MKINAVVLKHGNVIYQTAYFKTVVKFLNRQPDIQGFQIYYWFGTIPANNTATDFLARAEEITNWFKTKKLSDHQFYVKRDRERDRIDDPRPGQLQG